ncbi:MAG TPA: RNA polymerase factor sigma-54 [Thermoanaerobaculia bacterium]|nr:RNA polymerase factor sigma-54 [Thermoanaerobaculia bacterium]
MALEQKLSLKLAQRLVMTPSLQQAIKLLQMTRMELDTLLTQELVENPVLEEAAEATDAPDPAEEEAAEPPFEERKEAVAAANGGEELNHGESMENIDLDAYFGDYWEGSGYSSMAEERDEPPIENSLTREPDLYDHLLWQLHMAEVEPRQREIAELIIGNLNPDGFLVATTEEIRAMGEGAGQDWADDGADKPGSGAGAWAAASGGDHPGAPAFGDSGSLGAAGNPRGPGAAPVGDIGDIRDGGAANGSGDRRYTLEEVEAALELVRSFDPPGIACNDLRESLVRQMDFRGVPADALARRVVEEAWELFLRRQFPAVAKKLGIELATLEEAVELIRTLETNPGRKFSTERPHYIEPDVFVRRVGDEYVIQLNDDGLPRLRVSRSYRRMLQTMRSEGRQSEAQQFIKDKIRSAVWLIKSLDQRQRTIYKVAASIIRQQRDFLDKGIDHLRPMVLRDVAEDIGMHESTVSRVVSNKYIHTQRGLFPMKFFFHSGIDREYGENISSLTVKRKIEQMIQAEDPKRPLSDSELMRILNREGIQIARRTVAKYRDELSIPSSTDRKQVF